MKLYGSLQNRIEENRTFCDLIEVGTGVTEYSWSDRHPYEVVAVKDQKHVSVRAMDHRHVGDTPMDNSWELISDESAPIRHLVKRGKYWYWESTLTLEDYEKVKDNFEECLRLAVAGYDLEKVKEDGKFTKRYRANVSFGVASYYYDYEF